MLMLPPGGPRTTETNTPLYVKTMLTVAADWPDDEHANNLVDHLLALGGDDR